MIFREFLIDNYWINILRLKMNRINPFRATLLKYFKSNSSKYLSKETSLTFEKFCEEQAEKLDKEDDEKVQRAQRYIDEYLSMINFTFKICLITFWLLKLWNIAKL